MPHPRPSRPHDLVLTSKFATTQTARHVRDCRSTSFQRLEVDVLDLYDNGKLRLVRANLTPDEHRQIDVIPPANAVSGEW